MIRFCQALVAITLILTALPLRAEEPKAITLVVDLPLAPPVKLALVELERVLQARGMKAVRQATLPVDGSAIVIGCAGTSPTVDQLLKQHQILLSEQAESLCTKKLLAERSDRWLIAGRDPRGLSYAISDAARAIELTPSGMDSLASVPETVESPFLRHRSMTVHLFNASLEEDWYFSEKFWRSYLAQLVRSRYNNLTLTFCDQTNYLNPIYAHLLDVPGFSQVRVKGLQDAEKKRRLAMLRRIAELVDEHGLKFTLGIWTQLPVASFVGGDEIENLPEGADAAAYCAAGLKKMLKECPAIGAIQFRMNVEAGIPEDRQTEFYGPLFKAIRDCGRPMPVDLRYKGLRPETLAEAQKLGLDVAVSTKYWCEHMGLPYHPTVADKHYRDSRYSFGNMLGYPRSYKVIYQLWSVGSQRLLLWGDPDYAARFARSCQLGEGEGFEVFAPLTDKGFGNKPGKWSIFKDASYQTGEWEYERYWFFYLLFGRMGFNPDTNSEVWRREFRQRFGEFGERMERAYRSASQIIPLITASHQLSAGEWMWWPEMDTGERLQEYMYAQPGDTAHFYAIRSWKRTPNWRVEEWDSSIPGYVEDAVARRVTAKWTPIHVRERLRWLADETFENLNDLPLMPDGPEFRSTDVDLRVLALLGQYHAEKIWAATHLAFYEMTGERNRLRDALVRARYALKAWKGIVSFTNEAYHPNIIFGYSPDHGRRMGHHHSGNWRGRLAEVEADVVYLETLVAAQNDLDVVGRITHIFPGETPPREHPSQIEHEFHTTAMVGTDLPIIANVSSKTPLARVVLHYRPLDQTADWKQVAMQKNDAGEYRATIPGREIVARFDFQYYLEAIVEGGGGTLWPSWEKGPPYVVVKVKR